MNTDYSVLREPNTDNTLVKNGDVLKSGSGIQFPIVNGIPRFVVSDSYADDFGRQWAEFRKTQLDSHMGASMSRNRVTRCMRGHFVNLADKLVLEAGSGAGRFTEVLLEAGAVVHSFDLSNAVEANAKNAGASPKLTLVQADIEKIPFADDIYDYVFCLGVLQHTPSPERSIKHLYSKVRPGGYLVIDHYLFSWKGILPPPIGGAARIYRRIILMLPEKSRRRVVQKLVDFWFPFHWRFRDTTIVRRILTRLSPVHFHYPGLSSNDRQVHYEWALLNTHDGTTDFYKHLRTVKQIRSELEDIGATEIVVDKGGNGVEAFCRKPEIAVG